MDVISRYKDQIRELRAKLNSLQAISNPPDVEGLRNQVQQLLSMNQMFANKSEQQVSDLRDIERRNEELDEQILTLKKQLLDYETGQPRMFKSVTSMKDLDAVDSASVKSDQSFLTFSPGAECSVNVMDTNENTEQFLHEYQTLKSQCQEYKHTNEKLNNMIESLQTQVNKLSSNQAQPSSARVCENCQNLEKDFREIEKYNKMLQEMLYTAQENVKDLTKKTEDEYIYREQVKAFQEDFDHERKEKTTAIQVRTPSFFHFTSSG